MTTRRDAPAGQANEPGRISLTQSSSSRHTPGPGAPSQLRPSGVPDAFSRRSAAPFGALRWGRAMAPARVLPYPSGVLQRVRRPTHAWARPRCPTPGSTPVRVSGSRTRGTAATGVMPFSPAALSRRTLRPKKHPRCRPPWAHHEMRRPVAVPPTTLFVAHRGDDLSAHADAHRRGSADRATARRDDKHTSRSIETRTRPPYSWPCVPREAPSRRARPVPFALFARGTRDAPVRVATAARRVLSAAAMVRARGDTAKPGGNARSCQCRGTPETQI